MSILEDDIIPRKEYTDGIKSLKIEDVPKKVGRKKKSTMTQETKNLIVYDHKDDVKVEIKKKTLPELKKMIKEFNLRSKMPKFYSKLKKDELINELSKHLRLDGKELFSAYTDVQSLIDKNLKKQSKENKYFGGYDTADNEFDNNGKIIQLLDKYDETTTKRGRKKVNKEIAKEKMEMHDNLYKDDMEISRIESEIKKLQKQLEKMGVKRQKEKVVKLNLEKKKINKKKSPE